MANSARPSPSARRVTIPVRVEPRRAPPEPEPRVSEIRQAARPEVPSVRRDQPPASETTDDWKDVALRLQADMANYRKRQRRIAQEQAQAEQEHMLVDLLVVADNLDRTLEASPDPTPIRQGVMLARDELLRLLKRYGVERVEAEGQPFDPHRHEALDVVSAEALGVNPGAIVRVAQPGYRRGQRLLRPARVVVAR